MAKEFDDFDFNFNRIREYLEELKSKASKGQYIAFLREQFPEWAQRLPKSFSYQEAKKRMARDGIEAYDLSFRMREKINLSSGRSPTMKEMESWVGLARKEFADFYRQALETEATRIGTESKRKAARESTRPTLQWLWNKNLLPYLINALIEEGAVDDGNNNRWATFDGLFVDRAGKQITREDLALMVTKYKANKGDDPDSPAPPKQHLKIDKIVQGISGNT